MKFTVYGSDNNDKLINENSSNKIDVSSNGLLQYDGIESSYILTHKTKCTRQRFENQEPLTVPRHIPVYASMQDRQGADREGEKSLLCSFVDCLYYE